MQWGGGPELSICFVYEIFQLCCSLWGIVLYLARNFTDLIITEPKSAEASSSHFCKLD